MSAPNLNPSAEAPPRVVALSRLHPSLLRRIKRQATRERIHARVVHPIDTPRLMRDPLERRESRALSAIAGMRLLFGAAIIHGGLIVCFALVSSVVGERTTLRPPERLKVNIVRTPPPEPPPEVPKEPEVPVVPEFMAPEPPKPVEPPSRKTPPKAVEPVVAEVTPEPPVRRTVGLSLESTVQGNGPSFATGSSRMGQTANRAVDPTLAARAPTAQAAGTGSGLAGAPVQRAAARIPTRDVEFEKPQRLRPNHPEYPAALKAQGLEGDVIVSVDINPTGQVTKVTIARSSGEPAFDEAARRAALAEQFSPAKSAGQPVAFTLSYSYRFRIKD